MKIAICAIIKDEHRYLKEWVEWNLNIGFNEIHLFEDFGSKSHKEIVQGYDNVFLHSITECGATESMRDIDNKASIRQYMLYKWFAESNISKLDWCAFIDVDEYITTDGSVTFLELLEEFKDKEGVYLYWKMKGASWHVHRPEGGVLRSYTDDVELVDGDQCWDMKSIVNLNHYVGIKSVHEFDGLYNTKGLQTARIRCKHRAWINHYFTKSWEDWCERFISRGDLVWGHRKLEQFFEINKSMACKRDEMLHMYYYWYYTKKAKNNYQTLMPVSEDIAGVMTEKCGCTTLSYIGIDCNNSEHIGSPNDDAAKYRVRDFNGKVFSIWRDPVDRFISFYSDKVQGYYRGDYWVEYAGLNNKSVNEVLDAIESEITKEPYDVDGHIRRQSDFYPIEKIDIIVPIGYLDDFLRENGITPPPHQNVSKGVKPTLTPEQEERIKKLYAADYELLKSPKVWTPSKKS